MRKSNADILVVEQSLLMLLKLFRGQYQVELDAGILTTVQHLVKRLLQQLH